MSDACEEICLFLVPLMACHAAILAVAIRSSEEPLESKLYHKKMIYESDVLGPKNLQNQSN